MKKLMSYIIICLLLILNSFFSYACPVTGSTLNNYLDGGRSICSDCTYEITTTNGVSSLTISSPTGTSVSRKANSDELEAYNNYYLKTQIITRASVTLTGSQVGDTTCPTCTFTVSSSGVTVNNPDGTKNSQLSAYYTLESDLRFNAIAQADQQLNKPYISSEPAKSSGGVVDEVPDAVDENAQAAANSPEIVANPSNTGENAETTTVPKVTTPNVVVEDSAAIDYSGEPATVPAEDIAVQFTGSNGQSVTETVTYTSTGWSLADGEMEIQYTPTGLTQPVTATVKRDDTNTKWLVNVAGEWRDVLTTQGQQAANDHFSQITEEANTNYVRSQYMSGDYVPSGADYVVDQLVGQSDPNGNPTHTISGSSDLAATGYWRENSEGTLDYFNPTTMQWQRTDTTKSSLMSNSLTLSVTQTTNTVTYTDQGTIYTLPNHIVYAVKDTNQNIIGYRSLEYGDNNLYNEYGDKIGTLREEGSSSEAIITQTLVNAPPAAGTTWSDEINTYTRGSDGIWRSSDGKNTLSDEALGYSSVLTTNTASGTATTATITTFKNVNDAYNSYTCQGDVCTNSQGINDGTTPAMLRTLGYTEEKQTQVPYAPTSATDPPSTTSAVKPSPNSYSALTGVYTAPDGTSYYYNADGNFYDVNGKLIDASLAQGAQTARSNTNFAQAVTTSDYQYYSTLTFTKDGATNSYTVTNGKLIGPGCPPTGCDLKDAGTLGTLISGTVNMQKYDARVAALGTKITEATKNIASYQSTITRLTNKQNAGIALTAAEQAELDKAKEGLTAATAEQERLKAQQDELIKNKPAAQAKRNREISDAYSERVLSQGAVSYLSDASSAFGDLGDLLGLGSKDPWLNTGFVDNFMTMEGIADSGLLGMECSKDILASRSSTSSFIVLPDGTQAMHIEGYTKSYSGYVACDYDNNDSSACTQAFSSSTKCSEESLCGTKDNPSLFTDTVYFVTAEISTSMGEDVKFQLTLDNTVVDLDDYWTNGTWKIDTDDTKTLNVSYSWKGSSALYIPGSKIGGGSHTAACIKILNPSEIDGDAKEVWDQVEEDGKLCNDFVKPAGNNLTSTPYNDAGGLGFFAWGVTQDEFDINEPLS